MCFFPSPLSCLFNLQMKANQARAEEIGKSFCEAYYKTFDADRGQLAALYHVRKYTSTMALIL